MRRRINKETGTRKKKGRELERQREQKICLSPWLRREGGDGGGGLDQRVHLHKSILPIHSTDNATVHLLLKADTHKQCNASMLTYRY